MNPHESIRLPIRQPQQGHLLGDVLGHCRGYYGDIGNLLVLLVDVLSAHTGYGEAVFHDGYVEMQLYSATNQIFTSN